MPALGYVLAFGASYFVSLIFYYLACASWRFGDSFFGCFFCRHDADCYP